MRSKQLLLVAIIALIILVGALEVRRRAVEEQLKNLTVRLEQLQGNTEENRAEAQRIITKVQQLMEIDVSVEPTVATIVDVDVLRERNAFYDKAENGDFLVVTPTRAILYDEENNVIIDVIPVQITPQDAPADAE
jgi:Asp-tRNA(Asn)/Glu-tRNA(Gln) amidotransferase C subunit